MEMLVKRYPANGMAEFGERDRHWMHSIRRTLYRGTESDD